jgi:NitT/TauT family transport system permease protein
MIILIMLWEIFGGGNLRNVLPKPSDIFQTGIEIWPSLWRNIKQTAWEAIIGFTIGTGLGVSIAVGFIYSRNFARSIYPFAILLRSIPILALLPLLVSLFGPGITSKVIIITLGTFFPTLVNMVQGLNSTDRNALELMSTLKASPGQIFWKARFPSSLPHFFTSLKITGPAAVISAVISEWLWASKGLGAFIVNAMFNSQANRLWAALIAATAISICAYLIIVIAEKLVIPWHSAVKVQTVGETHG